MDDDPVIIRIGMEERITAGTGRIEVSQRISGKRNRSRRRNLIRRRFSLFALAVFTISLCLLCSAFIYVDQQGIVPDELFGKILIGAACFLLLETVFLLISRKSVIVSFLSILVCLAVIAVSAFGIYSLYKVYESMQKVEEPKTYYAQVGIYVRKESRFVPTYTEDEEGEQVEIAGDGFDGCTVGTLLLNVDRGYSSNGVRAFRKEYDVSVLPFEDIADMIEALREGEIDAIVLNQSYFELFTGDGSDFNDWAVQVRSIGIETENKTVIRKADVVSEPFIVYIAGIDTYDADNFYDYSRSDSNIVACVDPVGKRILLINTPRDYYVPLWGESYAMDKLTHAGVYGVDASMETLEALYDIQFNYYVRTNIYSLVRIVDALGGITVHSDYQFYAPNGIGGFHQFYVGENYVDGEGALCFIRERHSFENEDKQRGKNQQECIRAIVEKACSPAIVTHFTDVLDVVTENVRTNITTEEINALVRMQLSDMAEWSVEMYAVDGEETYGPSYALGGEEVFLVEPYYDTVETAREMIRDFVGG